jgi:hypothetical protein
LERRKLDKNEKKLKKVKMEAISANEQKFSRE